MRTSAFIALRILFALGFLFNIFGASAQLPDYTSIADFPRNDIKQTVYFNYDGDNLTGRCTVMGKDTTAFFRAIISDIQRRFSHVNSIGFVYQNGSYESLYNRTGEKNVVKNGDDVTYSFSLSPLPMVMDGVDSLEFHLFARDIDSIVFSYSGGSHRLAYTKPTPLLFANDTAIWCKKDLIHRGDTVVFKLIFEGPNKGVFSFSKYTLQQNNQRLQLSDQISNTLLFALPYWCLWLLFLAFRDQFEDLPGNLYKRVYTWLPALSGIYLTCFLSDLLYYMNETYYLGDIYAVGGEDERIIKSRIVILVVASILLPFGLFWRRTSQITWVILVKRLAIVIGCSGFAFLLLGLLNYLLEIVFSLPEHKENFAQSMKLVIKMRHVLPFTVIGGSFILLCVYKLFSYRRQFMVFTCLPVLAFIVADIVFFFPPKQINYNGIQGTLGFSIFMLYEILPFVPVLILVFALDGFETRFSGKSGVLLAGWAFTFLISFYTLPSLHTHFLYIPVTLICSIILCKVLLLIKPDKALRLISIEDKIFEIEKNNTSLFTRVFEIKQFRSLQEKYKQKFLKGEILPSDYDKANQDLEEKMKFDLPEGITVDLIRRRLEFGIHSSNVKNAWAASSVAIIISVPLLILYYKFFQNTGEDLGIDIMLNLFFPVAFLSLAGYCLGYFLPIIRGTSGWQKGFFLGLCMALAKLPYQFMTSDKLSIMFFLYPIMQEILIMTLIGFLTFDYRTIRKLYGTNFTFRHLAHIEGWSSVILFITIVLSAIMAGITAWITGNVTSFLDQFGKGH